MRESPILWALFLILAGLQPTRGADNIDSLMNMSLEDLSKIKVTVPAALTKLSSNETPASITTITSEDIARTPARNIYDLIEVYVPGALWMNYEEGPVLGVRGSVTHRAYKYLLRVNGRVLNNKGHYGAKSELEQWDLSDISRIEIVRGPGSVTYGPGAVAGVISITTHTAKSAAGFKASSRYISEYDSVGASISHGYQGDGFSLYASASVTSTTGIAARNFQGSNDNTPGYVGEDFKPGSQSLDYFGDYDDDPQIKVHIDAEFQDNWRIWLRYTQQGSHWSGNETKSDFGGEPLNQQGIRDRQWSATLDYNNKIRDDLSVTAMLSADSSDVLRRKDNVRVPDPDHILNKKTDFSETEILARGILNWQANDTLEIAVGAEYSWDSFGPGWGDDEKDMRLGDDGVIVSGPDSNAILAGNGGSADRDGTELFVGSGWETSTYSLFSEANLKMKPWLTALFSVRVDKNTYTDWLFSPRLALIADIGNGQSLKVIGQQAQRMNTADQLYSLNRNGGDSESEILKAVEVIYLARPNPNIVMSVAGFWNDIEIINWNGDTDTTSHLGNLQVYGIEPELSFKGSFGKFGVSYSHVKLGNWELARDVPSSAVSYSDYDQALKDTSLVQRGAGNDLNNWANHALKAFGQTDLSETTVLHLDGQLYWGFMGARDGLLGLQNAVSGQPEETALLASLQRVEDEGAYEYQLRFNASLSWEPNDDLVLRFYIQNLLDVQRNLRYSFDTGIDKASPHRVRFVEEPRTFGVRLNYNF